jgi:8-oxo-dGTP diphosphatase
MGELEGWKSCPRCGTELAGDAARLCCSACGFVVYASSKPTACALCVDDGRVLLARRAHPPFKGFWDIPGGFLDEGEDPWTGSGAS